MTSTSSPVLVYQENEEVQELERINTGLSFDFWMERAWQNEKSIVPKPFKSNDLKFTLLWCKTFQGFKFWKEVYDALRKCEQIEKQATNGQNL